VEDVSRKLLGCQDYSKRTGNADPAPCQLDETVRGSGYANRIEAGTLRITRLTDKREGGKAFMAVPEPLIILIEISRPLGNG
jgi:hypothetical protein